MTLKEILINSKDLGDYDVVYARRPWSLDSIARVVTYKPNETVSRLLLEETSFEYFLEATLIRDLRQQFEDLGETQGEVLGILLYYGEYDAFP